MIPRQELRKLARDRLKDAEILYVHRRYAGAVYLCGYSIELALKARICQTLKWKGFPETTAEMSHYRSFIVHDLEVLLHLSGIEAQVHTGYLTEWSIVLRWRPELRYQPARQTTRIDAMNMLNAAKTLAYVL
jgi:HEPN domain-containing protein